MLKSIGWYSNIAEANDVENDYWSRKAASRIQRDPVEQSGKEREEC